MLQMIRILLLGFSLALLMSCQGGGETPKPIIDPIIKLPDAPTNVLASASNGQAALSWNMSSTADTYYVKRASKSGGPYSLLEGVKNTHFIDKNITQGSIYYYVVSAGNAGGESSNSSEVMVSLSLELPTLPLDDDTKNYMGMNTWFLSDWDRSFAFVDAMKHARPWRNVNWNGSVEVDDLGWPLKDASTVVMTGSAAQVNGVYKLQFKGQADVSLMWASGSVSNQLYDQKTNTTTADVNFQVSSAVEGSYGLIFKNTKRTPTSAINSGFSHVKLFRPSYPSDGSVIFTKNYLDALKKTQVVRLMDWGATNNNITQEWKDRSTPNHMSKISPTYTGPGGEVWKGVDNNGEPIYNPGVAIEHQIQLCNEVGADCWLNIPPAASDDYVQKLALALRYGTDGTDPYQSSQTNPVYPPLASHLRVYIEYGNEIWNTAYGFTSYRIILDIVKSLPENHVLQQFIDPYSGLYQKVYAFPAYRLATISDIFRTVYGNAAMMNRVRPVLMTQRGNANDTLRLSLNWIHRYSEAQKREVGSYFYGAGGSAYYGSNANIGESDRGNADLYFKDPYDKNSINDMALDAIWAANFGLKRVAYEGGPGLDYYTQAQADAINLDPRMKNMIVNTHHAWSEMGGDLLVYYTVVGPREWNFANDISKLNTPKNQGLDELNRQARSPINVGQAIPGEVAYLPDDGVAQILSGYWGYKSTCDNLACWAGMNTQGAWMALRARSASSFVGRLKVNAIALNGAVLKVYINGVSQGEVTIPKSESLSDSSEVSIIVPKGMIAIRLALVSGQANIRSAKISQ